MHLQIDVDNPVYRQFELTRMQLGFTTFKSGVLEAMRMFNNLHKKEDVKDDDNKDALFDSTHIFDSEVEIAYRNEGMNDEDI